MAKTTPKTGKPEADRRKRAYTVRYNEDEDGEVLAAAGAKALEVGSWIRMVSVEAARRQKTEGECKGEKKGNGK